MITDRSEPWPDHLPKFDEVASGGTQRLSQLEGAILLTFYVSVAAIIGSIFIKSVATTVWALVGLAIAALGGSWVQPKIRKSFHLDCQRAGLSPDAEEELWYKTMEE